MKKIFPVLLLLLIPDKAYSQIKTFELLHPQANIGEAVMAKILPEWRDPQTCLMAFGKLYSPNEYGYVFIGIPLMATSAKEKITMVACGTKNSLDNYSAEISITTKTFPKTRTTRRSCDGTRTGTQVNAISNAFSVKNKSLPDLTAGKQYSNPASLARNIIDDYGFIYSALPKCPHYGVDLRMPVGTPVKAINKGIIALVARNFSAEGNMIILNHGLGIFSVYMHLSKIQVKDGEVVERGQIIGLSGRSGAGVREPHLHLNIRVNDFYISPLDFIDNTKPNLLP